MDTNHFKQKVNEIQAKSDYKAPIGFGICYADVGIMSNKVLQATYPVLNWKENFGSYAIFWELREECEILEECESELVFGITEEFVIKALEAFSPYLAETQSNPNAHKNVAVVLELQRALQEDRIYTENGDFRYRFCAIYEDTQCKSVESAYMKLLALSLGKAPLRSLYLDGIFGLLTNVAWSGNVPFELDWLRENEIALKMRGEFPAIDFVDKFPRYLMQVIPQYDNIRLLDTAKTRFGAYLGTGGYTQMPGASYVNFNAGAMGACMNEGRISSSVIVGEGSDVGGGASILGVLSGGNSEPISIGKNCLLGVNSSTGISLGDGCIVDGGIAILAGTVFKSHLKKPKRLKKLIQLLKSKKMDFTKAKSFQAKMVSISDAILKPA